MRAAITNARAGPQGTALADAVVKAVNVGRSVKGTQRGTRPPAVVILLSDGGQTAGRYSPQQAAAWARQRKIPISAVALGTPDGVVLQPLKGGFTERIQVPGATCGAAAIARSSGGRFYQGAASVDVKSTYAAARLARRQDSTRPSR